ncbi:NAD(P)-dependent oxidoreductase [Amycolatopsis sp.]|uniref:NAD-dependent epimerase/dehydratase family protein n=1 Tax=Amycolatopsis sp. TaxID=37632 RepID=UPI002B5C90A5|nr:NAD(P)-dependent oxidoreductase [Amycolatopsis sp.]HVV11187.1 NAD(P)-dependent oxidoreductase [Amycolatopsis sp.]
MTTFCVTGANGRIGRVLIEELTDASEHRVRCMVRPGDPFADRLGTSVEVVEASLTDGDAISHAVSDADVVVHLAAQMALADTPIEQYYDINVMGTLRVLEAAVDRAHPARRFVYASTDATYGPMRPAFTPITEDHPQIPGDYYGTSKLLCEQLVRNYGTLHDLPYTILRFGTALAPHESVSWFRLDWLRALLSSQISIGRRSNIWQLFDEVDDVMGSLERQVGGRTDNPAVVVVGPSGEPWSMQMSDVRDTVAGTLLSLEHDRAVNEDFNIVGPGTTTFSEGAAVVADQYDLDTVTVEMPMTMAFELSIDKASRLLGYKPQHDFASMVKTGAQNG